MSYAGQGKKARIRINVSSTIKEGNRYESTVELEGPFDSDADRESMASAITEANKIARNEGMAEVNLRNAMEGRPKAYEF